MRPTVFIFTCEHASNKIPAAYAKHFAGRDRWLRSHRGWDPGAVLMARACARAFAVPLIEGKYSRLLVDLNRTENHAEIFSSVTERFSAKERERLLRGYHRKHWDKVYSLVGKEIQRGNKVVHIGFHSFTPVRNGVKRTTDIGLLFDPKRKSEALLADQWKRLLDRSTSFVTKKNYPYKGTGNGLISSLRGVYPDSRYAGIELEVNQRFFR